MQNWTCKARHTYEWPGLQFIDHNKLQDNQQHPKHRACFVKRLTSQNPLTKNASSSTTCRHILLQHFRRRLAKRTHLEVKTPSLPPPYLWISGWPPKWKPVWSARGTGPQTERLHAETPRTTQATAQHKAKQPKTKDKCVSNLVLTS